jgi:outer membrane protein assembly factor BamA
MLGDHNLGTYVEVSSNGGDFARNIAAVFDYANLKSRLNWGFELSQLPYVTRVITTDIVTENGQDYLRQRDVRFWQTERRAVATLAYPFSRAERLEASAGYQSIGFAAQVETRLITADNQLYRDDTSDLQTGLPNLDLAVANLAWVHDNAFFGGTSPIAGSRGRFGVEPVTGDLHYTGLLADWRTYVMPVRPWTIAVRGLHYGRYGRDGESIALSPLFLGYPNLVRGYDDGSFTLDEVSASPTYGRLFGSRLAVGSVELRIPLVGAFGLFASPGVPPVEIAPFFDAGAAWNSDTSPKFSGADRNGVTSHGLAMRANLFGFLIGELDFVHPNDRPGKGWYWQFSIQPGF